MKILYHHRIASKDGQYVHVEEMVRALEMLGHELILTCPPGIENYSVGSTSRLVALLKTHTPHLVYELLELLYSFVAFWKLASAVRKHQPDCIYERFSLFLPAGIWASRYFRLPLVLEVNSPLYEERKRYDGLSLDRLARWTQRYTWKGADYVLPVTGSLARYLEAKGVPPERIFMIPNGVNESRFSSLPSRDAAKAGLDLTGRTVLGFTGFAREWHDHRTLPAANAR